MGTFTPSLAPCLAHQGCAAPGHRPGLPLTSAGHRLQPELNDPEETVPPSRHLTTATDRRRWLLTLPPSLSLPRPLPSVAVAVPEDDPIS